MAKPATKTVRRVAKGRKGTALRYRVDLPDDASKRGSSSTRRDEIVQLRQIAEEVLFGQDRFRERVLLAAVYDLYRVWVEDRRSKSRAEKIFDIFKPKVHRTAHPITVILAATLTILDQKIRSKWSQALQYAHKKNIAPTDLSSFMDKNGGMSGCASAFADLKRKSGLSKKKTKAAPKKR